MHEVAADLDVAEEAKPGPLGDPLERARDSLDVRVVRRDAEPNEPPRSRQAVEHVDLASRLLALQQRVGGIEPRRPGADNGRREEGEAIIATNLSQRRCAPTRQCEQPSPQPPAWVPSGISSPSSTWKEWPQPQDETAFGFSILKPDSCEPGEEVDRGALQVRRAVWIDDDTDAFELELVVAVGGAVVEAEPVLEAGAPATLDRDAEHEASASGSSAISSLTLAAASGVSVIGNSVGRSAISMTRW